MDVAKERSRTSVCDPSVFLNVDSGTEVAGA